jgi:hypothetical protein
MKAKKKRHRESRTSDREADQDSSATRGGRRREFDEEDGDEEVNLNQTQIQEGPKGGRPKAA